MASQLGHILLPLVSLTTTIQQQTAHASIGGNYANGYDHSKRDAFNGVVEQCPDMGVDILLRLSYRVCSNSSCSRCVTTIGL